MNKKEKKRVKKRHSIVFALLRPVFTVFLFFKYGYRYTKFRCGKKKPCLILSNHVTTLDPFMVALSFNFPVFFVASDDLFSLKFFSPIIEYLVAPIAKTKSASDLQTVKDCYKTAAQGGSICLFPEGNRTYNGITSFIPSSVVKLIRMLKLPVVLYKIEGGYGVQPRWAGSIRRGRMHGGVFRVLNPDEYNNLSDSELYKYICSNLYADAFADAETSGNLYKSAKKAEYAERFLYACPVCRKFATVYSSGNYISCNACGYKAEYCENLKLKTMSGKCDVRNFKEWDDIQKDIVRNFDFQACGEKEIFSDCDVLLKENIRCDRKIILGTGDIKLYTDRFEMSAGGNKFFIKDISSIAVFGKNRLLFYHKDRIYQVIGGKRFNALKYQNMFYHIKNNTEEKNDEFLGL